MFRFCLVLCAAILSTSAGQAEGGARQPGDNAAIDAVFSDVGSSGPGYAVGIIKDGHVLVAKGYGLANIEDDVPITSGTVFHLASLSKQFTASAVALLILDHKIALDDRVSQYIPETAKYGPSLRVEHLVYMTSGLHEYTDVPRPDGLPWFSAYYFTRDQCNCRISGRTLALSMRLEQSGPIRNVNYMVLTKIVEKASGESFGRFMHERVFAPLQMNSSLIDDDTSLVVPHRAIGYTPRSAEVLKQLAQVHLSADEGSGFRKV